MLQVLPALVSGGVERGTLEIAEALVGAGWRALVASAGGPLVEPLERLGARHVALPLGRKSPLGIWRNAAALAALVRAEGVGIVHARSRAPAWAALLAARRTGAHLVTTYHGTYNEGWPGKRLYNSVMARGERVIAISGFIAEHLRARHGTDPARLRVIPRGVDERRFDPAAVPPARVAALRRAWDVPEGRPVVMLPGRLTRWKGQTVLLDAHGAAARRRARAAGRERQPARRRWRPASASSASTNGRASRARGGHARGIAAGRRRGPCLDRPGSLRPHGDRGAGHGPAGDRLRPRRPARNGGGGRHRLARAARRPGGAGRGDRPRAGAAAGGARGDR